MLVLLAEVVFLGKIDQIDNRFRGEQGQWIDDLDLREKSQSVHAECFKPNVYSKKLDCFQSWTSSHNGLNAMLT